MKNYLALLLPCIVLGLTSCSTLEQLTCLVNQSTDAINCNRQAVEYSTEVIRQNAEVIAASTETVKENRHQLESASD